ncbi:MAG TPA: type II toxin-antitoxin system ParD family antitoxin [Bryobacteraceae bacterium]|jgi:antitoxin ParD1/3/4|nr:type II toxin-antitoxin system ParD family antitoxin [Bryobacteraceae bacterium]
MNIRLTPALEKFVKQRVASGLYNNASEVIREALRHEVERADFEMLKAGTASGFSQLRAGRAVPYDMPGLKRKAVRNSKSGRTINPLVAP